MYMFDLNWWPILRVIVVLIQIKHVHFSVLYQQAIGVVMNSLVGMGL